MKFRIAFLVCAFFAGSASAQTLLDAVRVSREPLGTGSRGIAMSGAMTAAVNDYSALAWNPAALTTLEFREFALGIWVGSNNSNATFLGTTTPDDISNTVINAIGLAAPVETKRGHLAFGVSLDRVLDYTRSYRFAAVNPNSSFLNTRNFLQDPGNRAGNYIDELDKSNLAWNLFLTYNIDSASPNLSTPFTGGLQQSGTVVEEGGLNALRIGAGVDIAENVSIGATANIYFGSYDSRRVYTETDVNNFFSRADSTPPLGFKYAEIIDSRSASQSGFGLKLGLLAQPYEFIRVGLTVETPTWLTVRDEFYRAGKSVFNFEEHTADDRDLAGITVNSYGVTTPMRLGAGVAFIQSGATVSASITYADMSQVRFTNADVDVSDLNDRARQLLGGTLAMKFGAEYVIAPIGVAIRGGYSIEPSAYKDDPPEYDTKSWSAGAGVLLSKSAMLEFAYRNSTSVTDHSIYNDQTPEGQQVSANIDRDELKRQEVLVNFIYRF